MPIVRKTPWLVGKLARLADMGFEYLRTAIDDEHEHPRDLLPDLWGFDWRHSDQDEETRALFVEAEGILKDIAHRFDQEAIVRRDDVDFNFWVEAEQLVLKGNVQASGNDDDDRQAEQWVSDQLDAGNVYAWCVGMVRAIWNDIQVVSSLGGVSCASRDEFYSEIAPELEDQAYDELVERVRAMTQREFNEDSTIGYVADWLNAMSADGGHVRLKLRFDSTKHNYVLSAAIASYRDGEFQKTTIEIEDEHLHKALNRLGKRIPRR